MRLSTVLVLSSLTAFLYGMGCSSTPSESVGSSGPAQEAITVDRQVVLPAGIVDMGQILYGERTNTVTPLAAGETHGYLFLGTAGDVAELVAGNGNSTTTITVFGPAAGSAMGPQIATGSSAQTGFNAVVQTTLPANGVYTFTVTNTAGAGANGSYIASMTCNAQGAVTGCAPSTTSPMGFGNSRITQAAIDRGRYSASDLFTVGRFLFTHEYVVSEGWGNALTNIAPGGPNARPNLRSIHNGKFGGPDSSNCARCHLVGGNDGAGDLESNLLQDGDGVNLSSALVRNPPQLIGTGYLQQLAIEMTQDLQSQLAAAVAASKAAGAAAQTVALSSKGVNFGSVVVPVGGTPVDFTNLSGIDPDLIVKPLGWKGRVASIRRFVEGGFEVHLGMQTEPIIASNCKVAAPDVVGPGPDCQDPDEDGVKSEITEGQLTAMSVYSATVQAPVRNNPTDPTALSRVQNGEFFFDQVGCASCHTPTMELSNPVHVELPDLTGGPGFSFDLTLAGKPPQLQVNGDGVVVVELYSDLKRHVMGPTLADSHPTFGVFPANEFMTPPLWGVANTAPYMHDGRSATLTDAILAHDGEQTVIANFQALPADSQNMLLEFLATLGRDPAHVSD